MYVISCIASLAYEGKSGELLVADSGGGGLRQQPPFPSCGQNRVGLLLIAPRDPSDWGNGLGRGMFIESGFGCRRE